MEIGGEVSAARQRQQAGDIIVPRRKARLNCSFDRAMAIRARYQRIIASKSGRQDVATDAASAAPVMA